jgi:hypothetical protein
MKLRVDGHIIIMHIYPYFLQNNKFINGQQVRNFCALVVCQEEVKLKTSFISTLEEPVTYFNLRPFHPGENRV